MKKICFIAQFPPPMHGLSKAVETLYNSNLNFEIDSQGEFEFEKVDITNGIVGGEQKKELLKKCYIFALPTRYPNEGQPISILEAMGNGMFIITTDHAGIPDIVKDGVNGIVIFNEQNKKMIYKEMLYISVTDLKAICNNNRIICQSHFSEKNYLGKMKEIYNKW